MSLRIETLTLGQLGTNCYLVWDDSASEGLIIDPADEGEFISQKVREYKFTPVGIVLTHGHFDHCLGLLEVKLNFKVPVYLNKADHALFKRARKSAQRFVHLDPGPIPPIDRDLREGQKLPFGNQVLEIWETPGHSPGCVTLTNNISVAFTGDTLFKDGVGRTDFSYSDPDLLKQSLGRLFQLPGWCKIYPGHGEPSTIKAESGNFPV